MSVTSGGGPNHAGERPGGGSRADPRHPPALIDRNSPPPESRTVNPAPPVLHTIGYTGRTPDSLVAALHDAVVTHLIDVRELPLTRKPGFSKTALRERLAADGLAYTHLRPLGSPRDARKRYLADKHWPRFETAIRTHLATPDAEDALGLLERLAAADPCCLLCTCPDPARCHRSCVVDWPSGTGRVERGAPVKQPFRRLTRHDIPSPSRGTGPDRD